MAQKPIEDRVAKPTIIQCPQIDFAQFENISNETIDSVIRLQNNTFNQFKKTHEDELNNLDSVMLQIKAQIRGADGADEDEEMKENDVDNGELKKLQKNSQLFDKLITSINNNAIAANAIVAYNLYIQENMNKHNNRNNNINANNLNVNKQLQTFVTVYDILWKIQGCIELWPHFAKLVKNSIYLQPWFWANSGYPIGFAISDCIKMIILGNIWIEYVDNARLVTIFKESIKKFNTKLLQRKKVPQQHTIKILQENEILDIFPQQTKVK